jgi:hypothetical protein
MEKRVQRIPVSKIKVIGNHRPLIRDQVKVIADSMARIGLKTPITVRRTKTGLALITGHHRLEAAKVLGWRHIGCIVTRGDKTQRRLWALAENLHRADLTAVQRAESVVEWEKLINRSEGGADTQSAGRQPKDKGISQRARDLGTTREEVRRSRQIAGISPEAKRAAEATGIASNQKALLEVAKLPKETQVAKVRELAKRKRKKIRVLSTDEITQVKVLKRAYKHAGDFKDAWKDASTPARQHFVKTVLNKADDEGES